MKVHTWERAFLAAGATVLVLSGGSLFYLTFGADIHLPGAHARLDPRQVTSTPPFDNPGVRVLPDGRYEAVVIGRTWSFQPAEIRVPEGVEVVFTVTSTDVIHGFNIEGTRLNMMLIPGQVSQNTYTFSRPGEYLLICHEYCGLGHHTMSGRVIVEPRPTADSTRNPDAGELVDTRGTEATETNPARDPMAGADRVVEGARWLALRAAGGSLTDPLEIRRKVDVRDSGRPGGGR